MKTVCGIEKGYFNYQVLTLGKNKQLGTSHILLASLGRLTEKFMTEQLEKTQSIYVFFDRPVGERLYFL